MTNCSYPEEQTRVWAGRIGKSKERRMGKGEIGARRAAGPGWIVVPTGDETPDAETFAAMRGICFLAYKRQSGQCFSTDSQPAIARIQSDALGPSQSMAIEIIELASKIYEQGKLWQLQSDGVWTQNSHGQRDRRFLRKESGNRKDA